MPDVASTGQRQSGFFEGGLDLAARDADVGDVEAVLGEFGAKDDETPMAVGGYGILGALGVETHVSAFRAARLEEVAGTSF